MAWIAQEEEGARLTLDRIEVVTHRAQKFLDLVDRRFRYLSSFIVLDGTGANAG